MITGGYYKAFYQVLSVKGLIWKAIFKKWFSSLLLEEVNTNGTKWIWFQLLLEAFCRLFTPVTCFRASQNNLRKWDRQKQKLFFFSWRWLTQTKTFFNSEASWFKEDGQRHSNFSSLQGPSISWSATSNFVGWC